ncbi:hypothetical protein BH23DEI1_BH23DEI1_04500 [soil metagenome]|nr:membrane protein insertion efficiency factor YidD [Trueperaceae bacterium]
MSKLVHGRPRGGRAAERATPRHGARRLDVAQRLVLLPIEFYRRVVSPLKVVPSCRFHPTCSAYAAEAVREHGALVGAWLGVARVVRCHPWNPGGFDPVPPRRARYGGPDDTSGAATEES